MSVFSHTSDTEIQTDREHDSEALAHNGSRRDKTQSSHSTGVGDSGRWSTQRIAIYALFVALAMAVSFLGIPIIPNFNWLKFDPSGIVCLIAGFAFSPAAAAIVAILSFLPHVFNDPWGTLIAIIVLLALCMPSSVIYKRHPTRVRAAIGIIVGSVCALIMAIALNLLITPIYTGWPVERVVSIIVPALLPFNLIKFTVDGVVTFLIYKPISNYLNR